MTHGFWHMRPALEFYGRAAQSAEVAVVEGVMGLYDGHANLTEQGSTAEVAKLLRAPVVLIASAARVARSVAAEVLGFQKFDPSVNIAGVILNGVGSPRHLEFCKPPIEDATGLPVLGYMPRREDLRVPERHLGLIPTVEGVVVEEWFGQADGAGRGDDRPGPPAGSCENRLTRRGSRRARFRRSRSHKARG